MFAVVESTDVMDSCGESRLAAAPDDQHSRESPPSSPRLELSFLQTIPYENAESCANPELDL